MFDKISSNPKVVNMKIDQDVRAAISCDYS